MAEREVARGEEAVNDEVEHRNRSTIFGGGAFGGARRRSADQSLPSVAAAVGGLSNSHGLMAGLVVLQPTLEAFPRGFSVQELVELLEQCIGTEPSTTCHPRNRVSGLDCSRAISSATS